MNSGTSRGTMVRSTQEFKKRESDCPISPPNSGLSGYFVSRCCAMRNESWIVVVAVNQDRHLVLLAECDRGLVADAHRSVFGRQPLVRERVSCAPGIEAVAAVVQPAEFVQCQRHVAPLLR